MPIYRHECRCRGLPQPGGVRCWMSGAGQTRGVLGMEKAGCWRMDGQHSSL